MAKIDELLKELCPDGVEWKTIKELFETRNGYTPSTKNSSFWTNGDIPWFKMEDIRDKGHILADAYSHITKSALKGKGLFKANSIILATSATIGEHALITVDHLSNQRFTNIYPKEKWVNKIHMKFVYYYMYLIDEWCKTHVKQGSFAAVDMDGFYKQEIPIPPLSIQQEIVEVLDTFTDAISNLEEELALREKQFEFYKEQLLSFDDEASLGGKLFSDKVKYVKLKDICLNICSGGTPLTSNKEYYSGSNPWLRTQEVDWNDVYDTELKISEDAIKNSSAKLIPANCLIVAMYGATAGKCCINRIPLTTNQACCNLQIDERQALVKYVFHWVCKEYHHIKSMGEGSQSNLNAQKVKSYPVPLPSISSQKEIVEILDTFEAMIANIKEEIALRTKQYEYYREKLLSFGK